MCEGETDLTRSPKQALPYSSTRRVSSSTWLKPNQVADDRCAVRGSISVLEALLRNNADIEAGDFKKYQITHVAAQYGQTAVLYHLALKWNVNIDIPDDDGRCPIHWAAYKGFPDTIRLLLVLDARYTSADKEGCTPLHWSAIKGHGEACTVLLQGGSAAVLECKDETGITLSQLAYEKGHRYLGRHLSQYKSKKENAGGAFGKNGTLSWLTSSQLCPIVWLLGFSLIGIFVYKVMAGPHEHMGPVMTCWSWSIVIVASLGFVYLYKTTVADPGYIPSSWDTAGKEEDMTADVENSPGGTSGSSEALQDSLLSTTDRNRFKAIDSPALWAEHWNQLCVSCRIVRPLRAKHCSVSNRCIEVYDHYCPWVGNAIGKGNRHYFILFLWMELYAVTVSAIIAAIQMRGHMGGDSWDAYTLTWIIFFLVLDLFVGLSVAAMAIAQASQAARNLTTNELANWYRYKYLQSADGKFQNPFCKGCWGNCQEVFQAEKAPTAPTFLPATAH
eukprot:gene4755-34505_t